MLKEQDISVLDIEQNITLLLQKNNLLKVKDIWILSKQSLKKMGFTDMQIKKISIKMQLHGLDLNQKKY